MPESKLEKSEYKLWNSSRYMELPDALNKPWNKAGLGLLVDDEIEVVMDFEEQPHLALVGELGAGISSLQHVVAEHCASHHKKWNVLVFDLTDIWDFNRLSRINPKNVMTFESKTGIAQEIDKLYANLVEQVKQKDDKHILVVIPRMKDFRNAMTNVEFTSIFTSKTLEQDMLVNGEKSLKLLDEIFSLGAENNIHFLTTDFYRKDLTKTMEKEINKGTVKLVGSGEEFFKDHKVHILQTRFMGLDVSDSSKNHIFQMFIPNFKYRTGNPAIWYITDYDE